MTNTLSEAVIVRQQKIALQRKEHMLTEHKKRHKEKQEMRAAAPAVKQKPSLVVWILYDTTTDIKYIKMNPANGSLAIFDNEEAAMAAKKLQQGTDYKRCEYYSDPQPAPEVAKLVEALEEARLTLEVIQGRGSSVGLTIAIIDRALEAHRKQEG